jgi:hypothetical protein
MFLLQSTSKRLVVMLIPICIVWTFVACVMICTAHASETQRQHGAWSPAENEFSQATDCCPIGASQVSVLPDRRSLARQVHNNHSAFYAQPVELQPRRLSPYAHTLPGPIFADPPIERTCALRI